MSKVLKSSAVNERYNIKVFTFLYVSRVTFIDTLRMLILVMLHSGLEIEKYCNMKANNFFCNIVLFLITKTYGKIIKNDQ